MMRPLELRFRYGKPMKQLESAMISALSHYGDSQWFSVSNLAKTLHLPVGFPLQDDLERLISQRLEAWNWYCHKAKWGDRYVRRNHNTKPKQIMLADRQTVRTGASWPPQSGVRNVIHRKPTSLLDSNQKRKRSLQLHRAR